MKNNIEDMTHKSVYIDKKIKEAYVKGLYENLDRKNRLLTRCLTSIQLVGQYDWSQLIHDIKKELKGN